MTDYYLIEKETANAIYDAIKNRYEQASIPLGEVAGKDIADAISRIPTSAGGDPVNPMTISISQGASSVSINTIKILTQSEWGALTPKDANTLYIIVENNT